MRSRSAPRDFGTGELAPQLDGIVNEITARGLLILENWIVRKTGAAIRRPGTFFAGEVKDSNDATIVVPVEIDTTNSFVLELGDAYIRFYQQNTHAVIGAPYEVASPWSTGELSDLRWQYIPDEKAVYWVHPSHAMRKLAFTSAADWSINIAATDAFKQAVLVTHTGRIYRTDDFVHWDTDRINVTGDAPHAIYRTGISSTKHGIYLVPDTDNDALYGSEDGVSWVSIGPTTNNPLAVAIDRYGIIVLGGSGTDDIWASEDGGLTWDQQIAPTASGTAWQTIAVDEITNRWRAIRTAAAGATSFDGRSWSSGPGAWAVTRDLAGYNDFWVAVGNPGGIKYAASVGAAFTTAVSVTNHSFQSIAYSPTVPMWVVAKKSDNTTPAFVGSG